MDVNTKNARQSERWIKGRFTRLLSLYISCLLAFLTVALVLSGNSNLLPGTGDHGSESQIWLPATSGQGPSAPFFSQIGPKGDWLAEAEITAAGNPARAIFIFAMQPESGSYLALHLQPDRTELVRYSGTQERLLTSYRGADSPPWNLGVQKRGAYYSFKINGSYLGFTFHPSGDLASSGRERSSIEPESTQFGIIFPSQGKYELRKLSERTISFGVRMERPIISPGPRGSWNAAETFPGAVLEYEGTYYLYLNGTDWTSEGLEGGGHTRVGLATSKDLRTWMVDPRGVILGLGHEGSWDSKLVMVNSATRTPQCKFAITYMGFDGKTWSGIGLAFADHPAGPFNKAPRNPVLRADPQSWDKVIHEHTLYRDQDNYILLYTGFDGKTGDRGGIATSKDLIQWTKLGSNPVFLIEGPGRWDSLHIRPRSLFRHGNYFYLLYEGAGTREKFTPDEGGVMLGNRVVFDSVGLARSKDLKTWERHPLNPAIPQTGTRSFDALWTGWPHAVPRPEGLLVLYAASDAWGFAKKQGRVYTGLFHFDYRELQDW